jgi:ribokinase
MAGSRLVVLGSVNADHVLRVEAFPRPGETVSGHGYQVIPGGKGANQAVAAARLGAPTSFIACLGEDDFGTRMLKRFKADGIDVGGVARVQGTPTGVAMIQISASGENTIALSPEANARLTPEALEPHLPLLRGARAVLMQLEVPLATVELAAREARAAGAMVVLNPAPARALPAALLADLSMITPNETEAEALTGVRVRTGDDARAASARLHDAGIETVIITLGERGAYLSTPGCAKLVAGYRVSAEDTTAAGDTFNGALLAALLEGDAMEEAVRRANAAAAVSVTRMGAQTSIPYPEEVARFLAARH